MTTLTMVALLASAVGIFLVVFNGVFSEEGGCSPVDWIVLALVPLTALVSLFSQRQLCV